MALYKNKYRIESARLQGWDYTQAGYYFVTICTEGKSPFFGEIKDNSMNLSPLGQIVAEEWKKTEKVRPYVTLDEWVVMPNHFHGILILHPSEETPHRETETPHRDISTANGPVETSRRDVSTNPRSRLMAGSLGAIVNQVKSMCTKRIWAMGRSDFAWQSRFYDHIIGNDESLQTIREYIFTNPLKWELDKFYTK